MDCDKIEAYKKSELCSVVIATESLSHRCCYVISETVLCIVILRYLLPLYFTNYSLIMAEYRNNFNYHNHQILYLATVY